MRFYTRFEQARRGGDEFAGPGEAGAIVGRACRVLAASLAAVLLLAAILPVAAAAAPVTHTVVLDLATSTDDVVEAGDTTVVTDDGFLEVGRGGGLTAADIGMRFAGADIPAGAVVQNARLSFMSYAYGTGGSVSTVFEGLKTGNVATFSGTNRPSQIAKTAAIVAWAPPAWSGNTAYESPDLAPIIQEIVSQPAWQAGNAIGLAWEDAGTPPWAGRNIYSRDFWEGTARGAKLSVTYTVDIPDDITAPVVDVTSPAAGATLGGVVPITADASDARGVTGVGFYVDGALLATDTTAPYRYDWDTASAAVGPHTASAIAVDAAGNTATDEVSFTVYRDTAAPVVSNLRVTGTDANSATIAWTTDEPATSRVDYGTSTAYGSSSPADASLVTAHSVTISGLAAHTAYHFRAASADGAGNAALSGDIVATTAYAPVTQVVTLTVGASTDDVVEIGDTTLVTGDGFLEVGRGSGLTASDIGLRFTGAAIPADAVVQSARLSFTSYAYGTGGSVSTVFEGLKIVNVPTFSTTNRPSQVAKTAAIVPWSPAAWSANARYLSPDLAPIVQEIVSQPGWQPGNAIALAWEDAGTSAWSGRNVYSRDFWQGPALGAELVITYAVPADTTPPVVDITAPAAGATVNGVTALAAAASDGRGVESVTFYVDGALLAADTTAPYGCSWDTAAASVGSHTIRAVAVDTAGNSASDQVSCTVDRDTTPPVVTNARVTAIDARSAAIAWTTDEPATSRVEYGTSTAYGSSSPGDSSLVTSHSVTLTGLAGQTGYHFRAVSADAAANEAVSADLAATTARPPVTQVVTLTVSASIDDVIEVADSSLVTGDGLLEIGRGGGLYASDIGLRFAGAQIPAGATIQEAHLTVNSYAYGLGGTLSTVFQGLKMANVPTFSTYRPSQIAKTSAVVPWAPQPWSANTAYDSPDLTPIVQEIIDQQYWQAGNAIGLAWDDAGTPAWSGRNIYSRDWWEGSARAAKLVVTYVVDVPPDTTAPVVHVTAPASGATVGGNVSVTADASDNRGVEAVGFYVDGALLTTDTTAPYGCSWDTASAATGSHTIRAVAVDAEGNSASNQIGCTVYRDTTAPLISYVRITRYGAHSATIAWTTNEPATSRVDYGTDAAGPFGDPLGALLRYSSTDPALVTQHSMVITGLDAYTVYDYTVTSADSAGNSSTSTLRTFTTLADPVVPEPPVASFAFDDTYQNVYDYALPILNDYGYPATDFIVTDQVDTGGKLTLANVEEMSEAGWEIGSHSDDHDVPANDAVEYEASVKRASDWLNAHGFTGGGFASPGGAWNHDIVEAARKYHPYLRVADNGNMYHPYDPYKVSSRMLNASTTIDEVRAWLNLAEQNHEWIVFTMHGVSNNGFDTRPALLDAICDELHEREIPVFTMADVMNGERPPATTIDCWSSQEPVMPLIEAPAPLDDMGWTKYWESQFGYPVMEAMSGKTLPTMRFYKSVPNGTYKVYANVYSSQDRRYRYYYSFNNIANPDERYFDADQIEGDRVYYLGDVTVTDGLFSLYTRRTDALTGVDWYFAWGWITLVR